MTTGLSITVDDSDVRKKMDALQRKVGDLTPYLQKLGARLESNASRRLTTTKTDPSGRPWKPWSPWTAKARAEDYCDGFGLSAHELDLIRALPATSHCFLVRHANHSVVIRLDLSGMGEVLTVLSGREASVRRLDALRARVGDDPAAWYEPLTGKPWPGDALHRPNLLGEAAE